MRIPRPVNQVVLRLLTHPRLGAGRALLGLEVVGRRTGRRHRLPVQYAGDAAGLVVVPGQPETKSWWRNLEERPTQVGVLLDGRWQPATATVLRPGDPAYDAACATYRRRYPRPDIGKGPVVRLDPMKALERPGPGRERVRHA